MFLSVKGLSLHFSILTLLAIAIPRQRNFFSILSNVVNTNFLHFLHTALAIHIFLWLTFKITDTSLGKLSESETMLYNENVYEFFSELIVVLSFFSKDLDMPNLIAFAGLFCFRTFQWIFVIKSSRSFNKKMLITAFSTILPSTAIAVFCLKKCLLVYSSKILFGLEFALFTLDMLETATAVLLDFLGIETNRSLYIFAIGIVCLVFKILLYLAFTLIVTAMYKFPFSSARSLLITCQKLCKKIVLFRKYLGLCEYLKNVPEIEMTGTCAICTDDIGRGKQLRCGHCFHAECLKLWCERETTCPICRGDLEFSREKEFRRGHEVWSGVPVDLVN
ncbi:E3 ubiquitin-protein ligase synoviolin [Enteropsectra breve]|nr:E3 ubiquitin-protein ligase synoviolin [Enteropsectra breve]